MSLTEKLQALRPNKEKTKAETPSDAILELFSGSVLKKRKAREEEGKSSVIPRKKKAKLDPIVKESAPHDGSSSDESSSDGSNDSSSDESESQEEINQETNQDDTDDTLNTMVDQQMEDLQKKKEEEAARQEKNRRTVFIGNLPTKTKKKDLKNAFKIFGEIESVRFRSAAVASPKVPKKVSIIKKQFNDKLDDLHAYVVFTNNDNATAALAMNGEILLERHIRVDLASHEHSRLNNATTVFIGNLPFDIDDESVWEHFKDCGKVSAVRVVRDPQYRIGKGFGYVMFDNPIAVTNALKLDQAKLAGRKIRISKAVRSKDKTKKKVREPPTKGGAPPRPKKQDSVTNSSTLGKKGKPKHEARKRRQGVPTERSQSFQGKRAVEGKTPRFQLPEWKQEAKRKNSRTKQKIKQKKRNK